MATLREATADEISRAGFDNVRNPVMDRKKKSREEGNAKLHRAAVDHNMRMEIDPYYATAQESGPLKNALATAGGVAYGLGYLGPKDILGKASKQEIEDYKASMSGARAAPGGSVGNIGGYMASAAPAFLLPGAQTLLGQGVIGAGLGGLEPAGEGDSRARNMLTTGAGAYVGGAAMRIPAMSASSMAARDIALKQSARTRNVVKDGVLERAQQAGFSVPPSMAGYGAKGKTLEAMSGKYKTNQLATVRNSELAQGLARRGVGLADDAPLTSEAMQKLRGEAYRAGYEPISRVGRIDTDQVYRAELDDIVSNFTGASRSFPGAVDDTVINGIDALRVGGFDAGDAIKMSQLLRDKANAAFVKGDTGLGGAMKKASKTLEDQIERHLEFSGRDGAQLLAGFREARAKMAKTHTVENAIREGGGEIDPLKIGAELQRGKKLTGELKTIGEFANNFRDVAGLPKSGNANPFTVLDAAATVGGVGSGNLPLAALPLSRAAARYRILSPQYQRANVHPNYAPNAFLQNTSELLNDPLLSGMLGMSIPGLLSEHR